MKRTIYTAKDVHELAEKGDRVLQVSENDVLTSVAKEAAELLGMTIAYTNSPSSKPVANGSGGNGMDLGNIKNRLAQETARVLNNATGSSVRTEAPGNPVPAASGPAYTGNLRYRPGRAMPFRIFLDTAEVDQIKDAVSTGLIDGIATNPQKVSQSGKSYRQVVEEIRQFFDGPIAVQALGRTKDELVNHALSLHRMDPLLAVKITANKMGLSALKPLIAEGVRTNATLMFNPTQGLFAGLAGSPFISPFIGRANMTGTDGIDIIARIRQLYDAFGITDTCIIAASIKDVDQVIESILAGAHAIAITYPIFEAMMEHPLTTNGLDNFIEIFKSIPSSDYQGAMGNRKAVRS